MKQQILIINGGSTYPNYKMYVNHLKDKKIDPEKIKAQLEWKTTIAGDLGDDYEVYLPKMPNVSNARYSEWKIWFESVVAVMRDDLIIVGHSLGGIFLAKYLQQNKISKKLKAIFLIAAPIGDVCNEEELVSFLLKGPLDKVISQVADITIIHSKDDVVVPVEHAAIYKEKLPNAKLVLLDKMGHFRLPHFPELVDLIKKI